MATSTIKEPLHIEGGTVVSKNTSESVTLYNGVFLLFFYGVGLHNTTPTIEWYRVNSSNEGSLIPLHTNSNLVLSYTNNIITATNNSTQTAVFCALNIH